MVTDRARLRCPRVPPVRYESLAVDGLARLGRVHTPHGSFPTPAFMPVGTQGTVKGVLPDHLAATGAGCVLANTYHLMLRPGSEVVRGLGGLHRLMAWGGPILTDSGGFQVFSLGGTNRTGENGVIFKSHVDGRSIEMTPAVSMRVQNDLGADIIMAFDHFPAGDAPRESHAASVGRTLRWAKSCKENHARPAEQALFGIVQGGTFPDLRERCAAALIELDFPGYAVGGLAVGEGFEAMCRTLDFTAPLLPAGKPRYLMGVGFPRDLVEAVARGIDLFDCIMPARDGRTGCAFTAAEGRIRLKNARFARDERPVEIGCDCYCCSHFSRGAIRHFLMSGEMLGPILLTLHNLRFYQRLMADVRGGDRGGPFRGVSAGRPAVAARPDFQGGFQGGGGRARIRTDRRPVRGPFLEQP